MRNLKQSTAVNVMIFMTDATDHLTGKTGLTLAVTASKDGGAFSSITPSVTERDSGWYNLALTTGHTDTLGDLALHITAPGADPTDVLMRVGPIPADAVLWAGTTIPTPGVAGVPKVDVTHAAGSPAVPSSDPVPADVTRWAGDDVATPDTAGFPKVTIKDGTGQGEIALTAGKVDGVALVDTTTNLTNGGGGGGSDWTTTEKNQIRYRLGIDGTEATPTNTPALGTLDAHVISMAANTVTASAVAADAVAEIQSGLSTYAGGDTAGTTTLLSRLTSARAGLLDNLDAAISTRSTYAGADTSGTTTLLSRIGSPVGSSLSADLAATKADSAAAKLIADRLATALEVDGGAWRFTGNALELAPTGAGGGASLIQIRTELDDRGLTGALTGTITNNLDAKISSRSTYAGGDTVGTTTLLARLTPGRATNLDNLDAAISTRATPAQVNSECDTALAEVGVTSAVMGRIDVAISTRSTYAGADTSGTTTLLGRLSSPRAANLDNLDAAVSTRSTFAGGAVASVTAPVALSAAGLDAVAVESGLNARQALALAAAGAAGALSGAATPTVVIKGAGVATTRITATCDPDGNRSSVVLALPA